MAISFNPPLGEEIHIARHGPSQRGVVQLHLTCALSGDDLEAGVKVQVWSNLPSAGRIVGDWGATTFEHQADSADSTDIPVAGGHPSPLQGTRRLHANFVIPASGEAQHFEYTYRLEYPSGRVEWLGNYDRNGKLLVDRASPFTDHTLLFPAERWAAQVKDDSRLCEYRPKQTGIETSVAELRVDARGYIYAFDKNGVLSAISMGDALAYRCLAFLVPEPIPNGVLAEPTTIVCVSQGDSVSFARREIKAEATSSFMRLHVFGDSSARDVPSLCKRIQSLSGLELRPVHCKTTPDLIVLASPKYVIPVTLLAVPLLVAPLASFTMSLPLAECKTLLPTTSPFALFAPRSSYCRFFAEPLGDSETISFSLPYSGGQVTLSPLHILVSPDHARQYYVSLLTPHTIAPSAAFHSSDLLTPPPSPVLPARSRASHTPSRAAAVTQKPGNNDVGPVARRAPVFRLTMLSAWLLKHLWLLFLWVWTRSRTGPGPRQLEKRREGNGATARGRKSSPLIPDPVPAPVVPPLVVAPASAAPIIAPVCIEVEITREYTNVALLVGASASASCDDIVFEIDGMRIPPAVRDATVIRGGAISNAQVCEFKMGTLGRRVRVLLAEI